MHEPLFTKRLAESRVAFKFEKYWQSVLRFGLPFVILSYGSDYVTFRLTVGTSGRRYDWGFTIVMGVISMFVVSTIWWLLMREIAAWKRKNQQ
jgi:hypothetical protein